MSMCYLLLTVDSYEINEVALHEGEWEEEVYSLQSDVMDGVSAAGLSPLVVIGVLHWDQFLCWAFLLHNCPMLLQMLYIF